MEMDIYMRRRLVALGGLVGFFIIIVLLIKSCGGDDEAEPVTPLVGATGTTDTLALSKPEFIQQADAICAEANASVGALDPTSPNAIRRELQITAAELDQLQQLEIEGRDPQLNKFLGYMRDLVDALESKQLNTQRGDTLAADEAQFAIDTAEVEARALGERYGFRDCGQFLDAGEAPGGGATDTGADTGTAVAPDTGGITPTEPTTPTAPDTGTPDTGEPAPDTGGITP